MKILLTRPLHDFAIKELRRHYDVEIHEGKIPMPKKLLISKIKDKDGLICYPYDTIDSKVIKSAVNLKAISTFSVGYNHIDVQSALERNITIGYTPEVLTRATADLTMALIIGLLRRITEGDNIIRDNKWKTIFGPHEFLGTDMYGKTLGIFGMGRIGKAVALRAKGFEMNLIYHNRRRLTKKEERELGVKYLSEDELFRKSDILSIHSPYTKETHNFVNLKRLRKMKKTSVLINTARGKIVNERDLIIALKNKTIAGAGLDVFENEPISNNHPLAKMKNVIITPHTGSATIETREEMARLTVKNLKLSLAGKKPVYQVTVQ